MLRIQDYSTQGITDWLERQELYALSVEAQHLIWKALPKHSAMLMLDYAAQIKKRIAGQASRKRGRFAYQDACNYSLCGIPYRVASGGGLLSKN